MSSRARAEAKLGSHEGVRKRKVAYVIAHYYTLGTCHLILSPTPPVRLRRSILTIAVEPCGLVLSSMKSILLYIVSGRYVYFLRVIRSRSPRLVMPLTIICILCNFLACLSPVCLEDPASQLLLVLTLLMPGAALLASLTFQSGTPAN